MTEQPSPRQYDLEDRTLAFAARVRCLVQALPRTLANIEDARQLIRSSGSVGANYIEANESLSKKDFALHAKISRKEAKESTYWLKLLQIDGSVDARLQTERALLIQEANELVNIFGAIVRKTEGAAKPRQQGPPSDF